MTLPTPTRIGQQIRLEKVDSSANVVTVTGTLRGVTSSVPMPFQYEVRTFIAESLSSWRVASGNTPKTALDAAYVQIAPKPTGAAADRTAPTFTRRPGGPIATKTAIGLPSIYWPCMIRVPAAVYAANPTLGRWRIYMSTDHDSAAGGIGMLYTNSVNPDDAGATWTPWRSSSNSATIFSEGASTQTETPCVIWNPETSLFHLYYQVRDGVIQTTKVATSPDGITWTPVGVALPNPPSTMLGYNHTGYAKVYYLDGLWLALSQLGSGGVTTATGWWTSLDGLTFHRDPRRLRANLQWGDGVLRNTIQTLLRYRGDLWAQAVGTEFTTGAAVSGLSRAFMAPIGDDLRTFRGRAQPLRAPGLAGEASEPSYPSFYAAGDDGRLWGAYRTGDKNSALNLAVMS